MTEVKIDALRSMMFHPSGMMEKLNMQERSLQEPYAGFNPLSLIRVYIF